MYEKYRKNVIFSVFLQHFPTLFCGIKLMYFFFFQSSNVFSSFITDFLPFF